MANINPHERLIFALDVPTQKEALALVDRLGAAVSFYKIGLELAMSGEYFAILAALKARGKKVFADLKFFDIPQTVGNAVKNLSRQGADFVTVHGDPQIIQAAVQNQGTMKVLAVTVLTSMADEDLRLMGYADNVANSVRRRALYSAEYRAAGVIASAHEASMIRSVTHDINPNFLIVTPGIRLEKTSDDQKRTLGMEEALSQGADYLVIGRPIRDAADPYETALTIQQRLADYFLP